FLVHGSSACQELAPELEILWQRHKTNKVQFFGVFTRPRRAQEFTEKYQLTFPMSLDTKLFKLFVSDGFPFIVVVNPEGQFSFSSKDLPFSEMISKIDKLLEQLKSNE